MGMFDAVEKENGWEQALERTDPVGGIAILHTIDKPPGFSN